MLDLPTLTLQEFEQFRALIARQAGIHLSPAKLPLVSGRLSGRLRHYHLASYGEYLRLLTGGTAPAEMQRVIDLLTTHETSFFREPQHFAFLRQTILPARVPGRTLRIWSAACSSGEEPYSIAMVLADCLGGGAWEVLASDISTGILARAQAGHYSMEQSDRIPPAYLTAYCLKGVGRQRGTFLVAPALRRRVHFAVVNLNAPLPSIGTFDAVFLRNVMIYFDLPTKQQVVARIHTALNPRGWLCIGHSESLHGISEALRLVQPGVYQKC